MTQRDRIREYCDKHPDLQQALVDAVVALQEQYAKDTGRETVIGNEALKAALAEGLKLKTK